MKKKKEKEFYIIFSGTKEFVDIMKNEIRKIPTVYGYINVDDKVYCQTINKRSKAGKKIMGVMQEVIRVNTKHQRK